MGMERALMRLMRSQGQAWRASSSSSQRGAVALSSQPVREYVSSTSSPSEGFSRSVLSDSTVGKTQPAWQGWSRGYADSSIQKDDAPQGNVEVLEFGTHQTTAAKRFAVGTTAVDVDEIPDVDTEEEIKVKAKEILQEVGEKIDETVEEAQVRQLQEKLVRTEGIGEVVQELYNSKPELDNTEFQTGASA
ncbi:hypothetical protein M758_7G067100 [Ceratodon purpureus]|nr:hypothetical protein M758_7G067100 [Ceratodon purpureus]